MTATSTPPGARGSPRPRWALLAERPCHLIIESGGSGGVHAYWRLARPLAATVTVQDTGEVMEPIERAHLRLIDHLGADGDGRPDVADPPCTERARVMRPGRDGQHKSGATPASSRPTFDLPPTPSRHWSATCPTPPPCGASRARVRSAPAGSAIRTSASVLPTTPSSRAASHPTGRGACAARRSGTTSATPAHTSADRRRGMALFRLRRRRRDLRLRFGAVGWAGRTATARRRVQARPARTSPTFSATHLAGRLVCAGLMREARSCR
jgi:hypothetical protein